jgi:nicotinate-nucleotide adenylyltransferase
VEELLARVTVGHPVGVSSTGIRMRVARGASIRYLVPDSVMDYIREHGLYRS